MIQPQVHLRLPCYDFSFLQATGFAELLRDYSRIDSTHPIAPSVGATGGVYKDQGRNRGCFMNNHYWEFLVYVP
jgi:hypothetical protein